MADIYVMHSKAKIIIVLVGLVLTACGGGNFVTGGDAVLEFDEFGRRGAAADLTPVVLNLQDCPASSKNIGFGQGSDTITGIGLDGGECVFQFSREWEGVFGTPYECRMPQDQVVELTGTFIGTGVDFSPIEEFCIKLPGDS